MARRQTTLAFNAKMYRHFAIVTVVLTAGIAMFADGEKRSAVVEKATEIQEYAEKDKDTGPKLIMRNANAGGGGSGAGLSGFYSDVGQNIYGTGFATSSVSYHESRRLSKIAKSVTDAELAKLGLTRDEFMALNAQGKEAALAKLNNGKSPLTAESTVKRQTNASLRRAGGSGVSADY